MGIYMMANHQITRSNQRVKRRIYSLWRSQVPAATAAMDMEQKGTTGMEQKDVHCWMVYKSIGCYQIWHFIIIYSSKVAMLGFGVNFYKVPLPQVIRWFMNQKYIIVI